jgi:predicted nucleotidyltransferase
VPGDKTPEQALTRVAGDISAALGDKLLSLAVHGSWVAGDFDPRRSDLDLLAVLGDEPDEATVARLARLHDAFDVDYPEWSGRVEVDYVSAAAVRDVVGGSRTRRRMVRVSPGEPLHLVEATSHYILNWRSAIEHDRVLAGVAPSVVLPAISTGMVRDVVSAHLRQWPEWVADMRTPGAQAYAVLTICRALTTLETGRQVSKRAGASYAAAARPAWSGLVEWAVDWWYAGGSDDGPGRLPEITAFVREVASLLESGPAPDPPTEPSAG